ncbi:MAG TPA: ECF transporter S component [Thermoleophilia bacterium]|nr:ECF transporter S component [Thermoleophilia bacterium]
MRFSTKDLVTIAVFGALWGSVEMTLGAWLHAANVPFSGLVLSGVGMSIALTGYVLVPRAGTVLMISLVAALLKAFSVGGVVINPMFAIVVEGLLAELGLFAGGRRRTVLPFLLAGVLAVSWTLVQPFFTQGVLVGDGVIEIYAQTVRRAAGLLGLDAAMVVAILVVVALAHVAVGLCAGGVAIGLGRQLTRRLRMQAPARAPHG